MTKKINIMLPERIFGCSTIEVVASDTQQAYQALIDSFPSQYADVFVIKNNFIAPKAYVTVFVNDEICYLPDYSLNEGDCPSLNLAISGG